MNYVETFQLKPCGKILLEYYEKMSDERDGIAPLKKREVTNASIIDELFSILNKLPDAGQVMIKMGDVSVLNVRLIYEQRTLYFTLYEGKIKTPHTSFFSPDLQEEILLYEFLEALLNL